MLYLAYGHFTTIHPGHIRYLENAKSHGETLIIALVEMKDGERDRYEYSQSERSNSLRMLDIAETIILLKGDSLEELIRRVKPKALVLGGELKKEKRLDRAIKLMQEYGNEVKFDAGEAHYASADLLLNTQGDIAQKRINELKAACIRQKIDAKTLKESTKKWENTKILIVGDLILDEYAACEPIGISAEAPVIVVKELAKKIFIGAAGIVAAHIHALGANCKLVSVIGDDSHGSDLENILSEKGIDSICERRDAANDLQKTIYGRKSKIISVSKLEEKKINKEIEETIIEQIEKEAGILMG